MPSVITSFFKGQRLWYLQKITSKEGKKKTVCKVLLFLFSGIICGTCFNVCFGSVLWNTEGILGGLVSSILIYIIS